MTSTGIIAASHELTADEITWAQRPAPRTDPRPLLDVASEIVLTIEDNDLADLVEALALMVIEQMEETEAKDTVLKVALSELHRSRSESERLKFRNIELRKSLRRRRRVA